MGESRESGERAHIPVMTAEVCSWLSPSLTLGNLVVDCTIGQGGHATALLEAVPGIRLLGLDRDQKALDTSALALARFGDAVTLVKLNFADLELVDWEQHGKANGVLYDFGISSAQLDDPERGFQFRGDNPLDMRMDLSLPKTAADVVNAYKHKELRSIIGKYGDERYAGRIASAIVRSRGRRPIETTGELAEVIASVVPAGPRRGPHPARRTFQALRMEVNGEPQSIELSLTKAVDVTVPGGRIAAISYHSGEDRIVKQTFSDEGKDCTCPSDFPQCVCGVQARLRVLTRKPIRPTVSEIASNRRADSAKLRVAERLENPELAVA